MCRAYCRVLANALSIAILVLPVVSAAAATGIAPVADARAGGPAHTCDHRGPSRFCELGNAAFFTATRHAAVEAEAGVGQWLGVVDLARVMEQMQKSPEWIDANRRFEVERIAFQQEIAAMTNNRYLTPVEREELVRLTARTNVTMAERARVTALQSKSEALDREAQALAALEKPDQAQQQRIEDLARLRQIAIVDRQRKPEVRPGKPQKRGAAPLDEMQDRILKVIQQVAKRKGLRVVLNQRAIMLGGYDLTDEVLLKLGAPRK